MIRAAIVHLDMRRVPKKDVQSEGTVGVTLVRIGQLLLRPCVVPADPAQWKAMVGSTHVDRIPGEKNMEVMLAYDHSRNSRIALDAVKRLFSPTSCPPSPSFP
jgi:hypothetical protein